MADVAHRAADAAAVVHGRSRDSSTRLPARRRRASARWLEETRLLAGWWRTWARWPTPSGETLGLQKEPNRYKISAPPPPAAPPPARVLPLLCSGFLFVLGRSNTQGAWCVAMQLNVQRIASVFSHPAGSCCVNSCYAWLFTEFSRHVYLKLPFCQLAST
jgi:hypothetical protein